VRDFLISNWLGVPALKKNSARISTHSWEVDMGSLVLTNILLVVVAALLVWIGLLGSLYSGHERDLESAIGELKEIKESIRMHSGMSLGQAKSYFSNMDEEMVTETYEKLRRKARDPELYRQEEIEKTYAKLDERKRRREDSDT
jgi:hypothetical protein